MTTTPNLIQRMKEARAKSRQGEWFITEDFGICSGSKSNLCEQFNILDCHDQIENEEFICLAANEGHKLIEALEIAQKVLSGKHEGCTRFAWVYCCSCRKFPMHEGLTKIEELLK